MPAVSSPLTTTQPYIPVLSAAQRTRVPGMSQHFATLADLVAAVTAERANIAQGLPIWFNGTRITVSAEPGIVRTWKLDAAGADDAAKAAASHARTVTIRSGLDLLLAGDSNAVLLGAPSGGANGDICVDWASNLVSLKSGGNWASLQAIQQNTSADAYQIVGQNYAHQALQSGGTAQSSVVTFTFPENTQSVKAFFAATAVDQKWRMAIECPIGATPISASVNGSLEWTVEANSDGVIADIKGLSIKAGTAALIHTFTQAVSGNIRVSEAQLLSGESSSSITDTTDYTRTAGQIPGGATGRTDGPANVLTVRPTWIAARRGGKRSIMGAGDSIQRGIGIPGIVSAPALNQRMANWFAKSLIAVGHQNWVNYSVSNELITSMFDGNTTTGAHTWSWKGKNATWPFADVVFSNLSTNDFASKSGVQICTAIHDLAKYLFSLGKELIPVTNLPRTATTGNLWQASTQVVQFDTLRAFVNGWMRGGFQLDGAGIPVVSGGTPSPYIRRFFDAAAAVEVNASNVKTLGGGRWICKSAPTYSGLTIASATGTIAGTYTPTVTGATLPVYNGSSFGVHGMVAVMTSGAASGQSALIMTGNQANTVPMYGTGNGSPTGVTTIAGLSTTPAVGDTLDIWEVSCNDGLHPMVWGHSLISDDFVPWLLSNGLAS